MPEPRPRSRRSPIGLTVGVVVAIIAHVAAQNSMLFTRPDFTFHSFRAYFAFDQLSYLSIAVDGSHGSFAPSEPFSGTGYDYYPHAYYAFLGLVSWITGVGPLATWAIVGVLMQCLLVGFLARACVTVTGRGWTGILAATPFLIGTFATYTQPHGWYTPLSSHAVLWGAYAEFFPLNGGTAGIIVGCIGLIGLLLIALRGAGSPRRTTVLVAVNCAIIGFVANIQTYSFLGAVYVAAYVAGSAGVLLATSRLRAAIGVTATAVMIVGLFLIGPSLASSAGPLLLLILGIAPALPGLILLASRCVRPLLWGLGAAVVAAAPQLLWTASGLHRKDPFLEYREASSTQLGVPAGDGFLAAAVPVFILAVIVLAGLHRGNRLWIAYGAGVSIAWGLIASNDAWGANQEPYRLWIVGFCYTIITMLPILLTVALKYFGLREPEVVSAVDWQWWATADREPTGAQRTRRRITAGIATVILLAGAGVSARDFPRFWQYAKDTGYISFSTSQKNATHDAMEGIQGSDGLVFFDDCIDPFTVKIVSKANVVFYNRGMAWPDREHDFYKLLQERGQGRLDLVLAKAINVKWLLTDSTCRFNWQSAYAANLVMRKSVLYDQGSITLWRLNP